MAIQSQFFVCVGFLLFLSACNYERMKGMDGEPVKGAMSWGWLKANIIQPRCLSCHNGPEGKGGVDLSVSCEELTKRKLVIPHSPNQSPFFLVIESGDMPRRGERISASQVELIRAWIEGGAMEGGGWAPPPGTPPEPSKNTYAWLNKNVFQVRCIKCHGEIKPKAGISFVSYESLLASVGEEKQAVVPGNPEESSVYLQVEEQNMPPGKNKLSDVEISAIGEWIAKGALDN